ncbi:hypothetical protein [Cryptosporangium phraense]|uniref:Uncharacterized protein n=1 Tax=Cryptosporangium phraense TaxID=2593070 RepID=A0A545AMP9_9ACTN|nr:hypothetical protein [Cryptosporangium phraense]TQS42531.1 hypothetical protein FL583_24870 [Cryptosporangium phraense]
MSENDADTVLMTAVTKAGRHRRGGPATQADHAIFLDHTGRRRRWLKVGLGVASGAAVVYTALLGVSMLGGGHGNTALPLPNEASSAAPSPTTPAPRTSAPAPVTRPRQAASPAPTPTRPARSAPSKKAATPASPSVSPSESPDSPESFWSNLFPSPTRTR